MSAVAHPVALHLVNAADGLRLVDVEGRLEDEDVGRLSTLLNRALSDHTTGIAVDLRGCPDVGQICLSALLAASSTLRSRGDGGVKLVTFPGTWLHRTVTALPELPGYSSASEALLSFGTAPQKS
jgi:anti-anti-sigma regulatory factor